MTTIIQTPTGNIEKSISFYKKLGFKKIESEIPNMWTDGKAVIEINEDRFARAGIKLFGIADKTVIESLRKLTKVIENRGDYLFCDPSGTWVYLINDPLITEFEKADKSFSILGNYAGMSIETFDISLSTKIWECLGFKITMGGSDQGWCSLTNEEGDSISLMKPMSCPHLFYNPSLTYFNGGKNLPVIGKVREAQIPITEEITVFNKDGIVDNIIIRDPAGLGFFVYND